jgi:hypothetical protein
MVALIRIRLYLNVIYSRKGARRKEKAAKEDVILLCGFAPL